MVNIRDNGPPFMQYRVKAIIMLKITFFVAGGLNFAPYCFRCAKMVRTNIVCEDKAIIADISTLLQYFGGIFTLK